MSHNAKTLFVVGALSDTLIREWLPIYEAISLILWKGCTPQGMDYATHYDHAHMIAGTESYIVM